MENTNIGKYLKRPTGLSPRAGGVAMAEEILGHLSSLHTLVEGGSKKFLDVKKQLSDVGMHIHKTVADSGDETEVRVVPHKDRRNKDLGYFTNDLDDALATGLHISKSLKESEDRDANGHHVETWGGGRYTSVAWYKKKEDADKDAKARDWRGRPPRVTPGRNLREGYNTCDFCGSEDYTKDNPFVHVTLARPSDPSELCSVMAGHAKCAGHDHTAPFKATKGQAIGTTKQLNDYIESDEARNNGHHFLTI